MSWKRGFWSLIVTQFQGAFSDNVLKNLVVFVIVAAGYTQAQKHQIGESVGALFALPFILFSMAGGYLADRCSKRTICIGVKVFEVGVMLFVCLGFWLNSLPMLLASVFLMGTHSAFFGPSKYGSLPELLPLERLSWGNGILELGTFMAIILGTVVAAMLAEYFRGQHIWSACLLVVLAVLGLITSLGITKVPAAAPNRRFNANLFSELWRQVTSIRSDRPLMLATAGNTYFNFLGALFLLNLFYFGMEVLHVSEKGIGILTVSLALGIGVGSFAAGYFSRGRIENGFIPPGSLGMAVAAIVASLPGLGFAGSLVSLAALGLAGGFFIVPVTAILQHRPAPENKGEVLAAANLLSFVGVFLASGAHWILSQALGLGPRAVFLVGGLLTLGGTVLVAFLTPASMKRFLSLCGLGRAQAL